MKNTLTSFLAGTLLLVGSAMAAQTSTSPKPAAKPAAKPASVRVKIRALSKLKTAAGS